MADSHNPKRILVVGAGAVGSYLGGWLSATENDVVFADPWSAQVEAINSDGLHVSGPHESFVVHPKAFHLHESQRLALQPAFDFAIVASKAYDTAWYAKFAERFVTPDGFFVSAQNCRPDATMAAMVGSSRCVGLIMSSIAVRLDGPGRPTRAGMKRRRDLGHVVFRAGEHNGALSQRINDLITILDPIDAGKTTDNLYGERWAKLCQNSMGNPVVAATLCGASTLALNTRARELQIRLASESAMVGLKMGLKVEDFGGAPARRWADASDDGAVYEELGDALSKSSRATGGDWLPSMGQDVQNGRPTEIDFMNGEVLRMAVELGIEVPVTQAIVDIVRRIDRGELVPEISNVDLILTSAGF